MMDSIRTMYVMDMVLSSIPMENVMLGMYNVYI
jgi:hypothetical protein